MTFWHLLFLFVSYTAFGACVYAVYRIAQSDPAEGAKQLTLLLFFLTMYWLLESWGYYRAPYYFYPPVFPDMIAHYDWMAHDWFQEWFGPATNLCPVGVPPEHVCHPLILRSRMAIGAATIASSDQISLSVLFLEASLTWSAMTTALLFVRAPNSRYLLPFLVALVLVLLDAFLDPVLSMSHDRALDANVSGGLEFWKWCVCEDLGLTWLGMPYFRYGVPVFNNAVWFAGPVILVALAMIFAWTLYLLNLASGSGFGGGPPPLTFLEFAYMVIVLIGALLVFAYSPSFEDLFGFEIPIWFQNLALVALMVGTGVATLLLSGGFTGGHPFRWELVYPSLAVMLFVLLAWLFGHGGAFLATLEWLWIVVLLALLAVVAFILRPYV